MNAETPLAARDDAPASIDADAHRERAEAMLGEFQAAVPSTAMLDEARALVTTLRNLRAYALMARLAEAVRRLDPADLGNACLYAQSLIETGLATAAIDVLEATRRALPESAPETLEAQGLLGRAHKQIFFDLADRAGPRARSALAAAIAAYRQGYEADPRRNTWHGVNLLALLSHARRRGWADVVADLDPTALAGNLVARLLSMPMAERDAWHQPTLAEATLGLCLATGDLQPVEAQLRDYIGNTGVQAFQVASTLRQFSEVWELEDLAPDTPGTGLRDAAGVQRARGLIGILRARLMRLPGGELTLPAASIQAQPAAPAPDPTTPRTSADPDPDRSQLEAILGAEGPQTYAWWRAGLDAARSVGIIRQRLGNRLGTGFLVRAGDFGLQPAEEPLLLTNHHVVNAEGEAPGIRPDQAEVVFEANDANRAFAVSALLWSSPVDQQDASLLRLAESPTGIGPLSIGTALPALPGTPAPRVYVVGYPGGRELSFSFQDNELLDHEGPPDGKPQIPGVCRVHYHAPTEGGNSGSPVFEATAWQVIALHHKGGKFGMPRLNGIPGMYAANEGLAMSNLVTAVKSTLGRQDALQTDHAFLPSPVQVPTPRIRE